MLNFYAPMTVPPGYRDVMVMDIESRSDIDIKKYNVDVYSRHPSTEILMVSWRLASWGPGAGKAVLWTFEDPREDLEPFIALMQDPAVLKKAFNTPFEHTMFARVWNLPTPIEQWQDVMVEAYAHGFTGSLEAVGAQMDMPEELSKDDRGTRLIHKFCKPRGRMSKTNQDKFWTPQTAPEDWSDFCDYCRQDTDAEFMISVALEPWPIVPWLWDEWRLDLSINDRGVPLDMRMVEGAEAIAHREIDLKLSRMSVLTGLQNPNSRDQLLGWLKENGIPGMPNMQAETITELLAHHRDEIPDLTAQILELRQETSGNNWKKFLKMAAVEVEGRARGMFQFVGASRTGREAGRILQLQNLARGTLKDPATAADVVSLGDHAFLSALYPDVSPMKVLTGVIRGAITAPPGKMISVADLSSIESTVLAWIADCRTIIDLFYSGKDTYRAFAVHYFGILYEQVTKDQRSFCKPPVLGAGYMLGATGLVAYAAGMGVDLTLEEAERMVNLFRTLYPEIPVLWYLLRDTIFAALNNPGEQYFAGKCWFRYDGTFLMITLPSGRNLHYYKPEIREQMMPWGKLGLAFTYMGIEQGASSNKWRRISAHPGKVTENIVQAIARDLLFHGMALMDRIRLPIIGHVHDETMAEVPEHAAEAALAAQIECMTTHPWWADRKLFLGASGFITRRYRKD